MNSNPINILLVEDNPADADLISEAFAAGVLRPSIEVVPDGAAAIERLCSPARAGAGPLPALILLDINLPRLDGRKVLARLRQQETTKHIPVIVVSSSNAELDVAVSYQMGANCFITKPLEFSAFRRLIHQIESFWFNVVRLPGAGHQTA